jgi:hypothetical protein
MEARDQRTVVVSVDLCVAVVSPRGPTDVPLELDLFESLCTPSMLDERWLLLVVEVSDGIGMAGIVVDCVDDVLEDELCARDAPVISVTATVAISKDLIISGCSGRIGCGRDRSLSVW